MALVYLQFTQVFGISLLKSNTFCSEAKAMPLGRCYRFCQSVGDSRQPANKHLFYQCSAVTPRHSTHYERIPLCDSGGSARGRRDEMSDWDTQRQEMNLCSWLQRAEGWRSLFMVIPTENPPARHGHASPPPPPLPSSFFLSFFLSLSFCLSICLSLPPPLRVLAMAPVQHSFSSANCLWLHRLQKFTYCP